MTRPEFEALIQESARRMQVAVDVLHKEFGGLRTGRAATSLLEPIMVDAYGSSMPITQVGTLGAPDPRTLSVQVWDKSLVKAVEKAVRDSGLGLNPAVDGQLPPILPQVHATFAGHDDRHARTSSGHTYVAVAREQPRVHQVDPPLSHEAAQSADQQRSELPGIGHASETSICKMECGWVSGFCQKGL